MRAAIRVSGATRAMRRRLVRDCTIVHIRVSRIDARYATATMNATGIEHALVVVDRSPPGWRVIFLGTGGPPCGVAPRRVVRELLRGECTERA